MKNLGLRILVSSVMVSSMVSAPLTQVFAATNNVNVTIDTNKGQSKISPYIYGTNYDCSVKEDNELKKNVTSARFGGNRLTAYNWENNASNAGSDWLHNSDNYLNMYEPLEDQDVPGDVFTKFNAKFKNYNAKYTLGTVQMAGYAAKTKDGPVLEGEVAPSAKFAEVKAKKGSELSLQPDLTDNYVYMDEFVNYLVNKIGPASTTGINGYCLDNEPALWSHTHARMHPTNVTCKELVDKSIATASAVKSVDPTAEVFGPELYGICAYINLQEATDWNSVKGNNNWYVDYYLEQMKKASDAEGKRLLDVFDIHYYSEATGGGVRVNATNVDTGNIECNKARMQATRSLWDSTYEEDSWVGQWCKPYLPVIPKMKDSINKKYPGTKFAITEYNFGGTTHISGGIAQADALGIYGKQGLYLATYWPWQSDEPYIASAFKLYTNYDGNYSTFGDTSVGAETSDIENVTVYSSVDSNDSSKLHVILLNKNYDNEEKVSFKISGDKKYSNAKVYAFDENNSEITERDNVENIYDNNFEYTVPKLTACHIVLSAEGEDDKVLIGDVDDNGMIDLKDYVKLQAYLADNKTELNKKAADLNGDGQITIADLTALRDMILA